MSYEELIKAITLKAKDRFNIDSNSFENILSLCPQELTIRTLLRLERIAQPKIQTRKTILVVGIEDVDQTVHALRWAAIAKELLVDPESSDLYLFICFNQSVPLDVCLMIESTEQFCRKYVLHPEETVEHFLERTFLAKASSPTQGSLSADPLIKSFVSVQLEHNWFDANEQNNWKSTLLGGLTGYELIEELFYLKKDKDETPEENNNK
jgi:hypothetical protein